MPKERNPSWSALTNKLLLSNSGGFFQYTIELLGMIEKDRQWNQSRTSVSSNTAKREKLSRKKWVYKPRQDNFCTESVLRKKKTWGRPKSEEGKAIQEKSIGGKLSESSLIFGQQEVCGWKSSEKRLEIANSGITVGNNKFSNTGTRKCCICGSLVQENDQLNMLCVSICTRCLVTPQTHAVCKWRTYQCVQEGIIVQQLSCK